MPKLMTTYYPDKIEDTLQQKLQACENFLAATLLLHKALESEELILISKLVACRDKLIKDITESDRLLNHYRQNLKPDFEPAFGNSYAALYEELKEKLKQIVAVNQNCDILAARKYFNVKKNLETLFKQEAGIRGYKPSKERMPIFMDIKT
jgi:hypothetical protein